MFALDDMINIVLCLIISIPFCYISMFTHEAGHALIASIGGMKPRIYMHRKPIGYFERDKNPSRLTMVLSYVYPKGFCKVDLAGTDSKSKNYWLLFYGSGIIAQFILMAGVIIVSMMLWGKLIEIVKLFLLVNTIVLVDSIVPKRYNDGYNSDGKHILKILEKEKNHKL